VFLFWILPHSQVNPSELDSLTSLTCWVPCKVAMMSVFVFSNFGFVYAWSYGIETH